MMKINLPLFRPQSPTSPKQTLKFQSKTLNILPLKCIFLSAFFIVLVCFPSFSWGNLREYDKRPYLAVPGDISTLAEKDRYAFDGKRKEDKDPVRERYKEWQNLPQEEKEMLRRRMDQLNQMSPQERQRYQRRFEQWQQLPPAERGRMDQKLDRWQELPRNEKDQIRRKFTK